MTAPGPELGDIVGDLAAAGYDLGGFSRAAVARAVRRRVEDAGGSEAFKRRLSRDPGEIARLGHEVIVRFTSFFRDPDQWRALSTEVLPRLFAGAAPVQAWSAGCASGEEPYTLAMVTAGVTGVRPVADRIRIHATDIDADALAHARAAVYEPDEMAGVPPAARRSFFHRHGPRWQVVPEITDAVAFAHADVVTTAPGRPLDLVVCRHTLMYLGPQERAAAVAGFARALRPGGVLFLESTDDLAGNDDLFEPVASGLPLFGRR